jgi:hypothetical protein
MARRIAAAVYPHLVAKQHQARIICACPSSGDIAAAAHQALKNLHHGLPTTIDFQPPKGGQDA